MRKFFLLLLFIPLLSFAQNSNDYLKAAKAKLDSAKLQDALELYDKAIQSDPNNLEAHKKRAEVRAKFKDTRGALEDFNVVLKANPDDLVVLEQSAMLKAILRDFPAAIADLGYLISKKPNNYRYYFERAIFEGQNKDHKAAVSDLALAIALNSSDPILFKAKGFEDAAIGNYPEAIDDFNRAINYKDKTLWQCYNGRANVEFIMKNYNAAVEDYSQALSLQKSASIYQNRGNTYLALKQTKEAIADYTTCIELAQSSPMPFVKLMAYTQRGDAKMLDNNFTAAIEDYNLAISTDPKSARPYAARAKAEDKLNNKQAACIDWQEALKLKFTEAINDPKRYCN